MRMKWLVGWPLTGGDIIGALFVVALLGLIAVTAVFSPPQARTNAGFGPDWDCTAVPQGEPVCIKKTAR